MQEPLHEFKQFSSKTDASTAAHEHTTAMPNSTTGNAVTAHV